MLGRLSMKFRWNLLSLNMILSGSINNFYMRAEDFVVKHILTVVPKAYPASVGQ